jgi:hypothetical protein
VSKATAEDRGRGGGREGREGFIFFNDRIPKSIIPNDFYHA